jgi:nucleoside-diphosphate-sugar epimerase
VSPRAVLIGGTGQIGAAVAARLQADGWDTVATHRGVRAIPSAPGLRTIVCDRDDETEYRRATDGADLVVDVVAYTPAHARQILGLAGRAGSAVVMSTGSVYLGLNGTHFGSPAGSPPPVFPVPIGEDAPLIDDDDGSYAALKAAMERALLVSTELPVSILRLGSVHGPYSPKLREWYFIKRARDGRSDVVLARHGAGRFSTSSTLNIAELVRLCAERPGTRALNAVDESLTLREKAESIYDVLGVPLRVHTFDGPPRGELGADPWDQPNPFVQAMDAAGTELGYVPAVDYRDAVRADLEWLLPALAAAEAGGGTWGDLFPSVVQRYGVDGWFRYDLEDAWLASAIARTDRSAE